MAWEATKGPKAAGKLQRCPSRTAASCDCCRVCAIVRSLLDLEVCEPPCREAGHKILQVVTGLAEAPDCVPSELSITSTFTLHSFVAGLG